MKLGPMYSTGFSKEDLLSSNPDGALQDLVVLTHKSSA